MGGSKGAPPLGVQPAVSIVDTVLLLWCWSRRWTFQWQQLILGERPRHRLGARGVRPCRWSASSPPHCRSLASATRPARSVESRKPTANAFSAPRRIACRSKLIFNEQQVTG